MIKIKLPKVLLKVVKSKFLLVPLSIVGLVFVGIGLGFITTKLSSSANGVTPIAQVKTPEDTSAKGQLLGAATTSDSTDTSFAPNEQATTNTNPSSSSHSSSNKSKTNQPPNPNTPACDQTAQSSIYANYSAAITTEDNNHKTWVGPDSADPGYQAAVDAENARHDSATNSIKQDYQAQLAAIHC